MIPLRVAVAVTLAAATAVVALAQLNLPTKDYWQGSAAVAAQWVSVSVMAVFILVNEFRVVSQLVQAKRIRDYDLDLRTILSGVLFAVVATTGANWDELSVCYYRPRGFWRWRRLVRVDAVMMGSAGVNAPTSLGVGEGVVGVAFQAEEIVAVDWGGFVEEAFKQGRRAWELRDVTFSYGLKWGQLRRYSDDHYVIASPTFDQSGDADGCILLSGPLKSSDVAGPALRRTLDDLATVLDRVGPPPSGWWRAHEH